MRVLLTGASSFTGYWFARELRASGAEIVATLRRTAASYTEGMRAKRVQRLKAEAEIIEAAPFGSERFLATARAGNFDILCHHAAHVENYRSPDFDVVGAVSENTANMQMVLDTLGKGGLKGVVLTGSVFEQNEGAGESPLVAFSPYGLSKSLTAQIVAYRCHKAGIRYGKFVIPNPFGPFEEPRFCSYLIRAWQKGETACVKTPDYIRDNIQVSLLAQAYAKFVGEVSAGISRTKLNPSGYVETQGAFSKRFAVAMQSRLGLTCAIEIGRQTEFAEPLMRINTDSAVHYVDNWDENAAWDETAEAYK